MVCTPAPAGWDEFLLDFFVQTTAAADSWISDTHHKMPVFDVRSLPGDTVSFPAVRGGLPACLCCMSRAGSRQKRAQLSQTQTCRHWLIEWHCCLALPFGCLAAS